MLSLAGLADLIAALEPHWASLPAPLPLFLHEVAEGLAEARGVADGAH